MCQAGKRKTLNLPFHVKIGDGKIAGEIEIVPDKRLISLTSRFRVYSLLGAISPWALSSRVTRPICIVHQLDIKRGIAISKGTTINTGQASITGVGKIDQARQCGRDAHPARRGQPNEPDGANPCLPHDLGSERISRPETACERIRWGVRRTGRKGVLAHRISGHRPQWAQSPCR